MRNAGDTGLRLTVRRIEIGLGEHIFQYPAERVGAVERALRPAQHLDPLDVEQIGVGRQAIADRGGGA